MKPTLGGTLFIYNGKSQDYCHIAAINSLKALCDHVVVLDAGSTDGTQDDLHQFEDGHCDVVFLDGEEWKQQQGREKLNYFTNVAIECLEKAAGTDYQINLQGDECIHEDSFPWIRKAIETGEEGFLTSRINLWRDPFSVLTVDQGRKPCSTEIIRLAKSKYRSTGDAESLNCSPVSSAFLDKIHFFHYGFVRDPYIMKKKVIHIQEEVFLTPHDNRLDHSDKFEWDDYFSEADLKPLTRTTPRFAQTWVAQHLSLR